MSEDEAARITKERGWLTGAELDAQRLALAREITSFIGTEQKLWETCTNRQCQRERSCIAPDGDCPMQPPCSEEELKEAWPKVLVEVRQAIEERLAEIGELE